jgi:hypothetical protein
MPIVRAMVIIANLFSVFPAPIRQPSIAQSRSGGAGDRHQVSNRIADEKTKRQDGAEREAGRRGRLFAVLAPSQPHAGTTTVFRNKINASSFESATDRVNCRTFKLFSSL